MAMSTCSAPGAELGPGFAVPNVASRATALLKCVFQPLRTGGDGWTANVQCYYSRDTGSLLRKRPEQGFAIQEWGRVGAGGSGREAGCAKVLRREGARTTKEPKGNPRWLVHTWQGKGGRVMGEVGRGGVQPP